MQITGTYSNYLNLRTLLSPLGVKGSGDLVMSVFSASMENLTSKINNQIFSKESAVTANQLYNEALDLSSKTKKLTLTDINSVFNDRTATSSNSNVLTASAYDVLSPDIGAAEATYDISVSQMAQTQENTGMELNKTDASVVGLGTNTFNININGQDNELSIEVVDGDTNEAVLQKIETAINDAGLGATAEVIAGSGEGTQQLVIRSDNTGLVSAFSVSDISGDAIAASGIGSISTESQDAIYTVSATEYSSGSNTIYLDDGMVTVNLEGAGDTTLTVAPDENTVKDAISTLVSGFNSYLDFLENNSDYIKDEVLSSANSFIDDHKSELESFGITLSENGRLKLDDTKLGEAVDQNLSGIKESFGGFDGLAVQLSNYTSQITSDNPLEYTKEAENLNIDYMDQIYNLTTGTSQQLLQGTLLNLLV
jgi:flagellar hook-associated protein 2